MSVDDLNLNTVSAHIIFTFVPIAIRAKNATVGICNSQYIIVAVSCRAIIQLLRQTSQNQHFNV